MVYALKLLKINFIELIRLGETLVAQHTNKVIITLFCDEVQNDDETKSNIVERYHRVPCVRMNIVIFIQVHSYTRFELVQRKQINIGMTWVRLLDS